MSYRRYWRFVRDRYPETFAIPMGSSRDSWFRIARDGTPKGGMEIRELGSGPTRFIAWERAAQHLGFPEGR